MPKSLYSILICLIALTLMSCPPLPVDPSPPVDNGEDYVSATIGVLEYVPTGVYQRDETATNLNYVRRAFRMGATEVTRAQFLAVMGVDPTRPQYSSGNLAEPAQSFNWYHAIAFCNKLSIREGLSLAYSVSVAGSPVNFSSLVYGDIPITKSTDWDAVTINWDAKGYRLPTLLEFMWAAMGASKDARPGDIVDGINRKGYSKKYPGSVETGETDASTFAWYYESTSGTIHPVAGKKPNELGLYDLGGNAFEWCWDGHDPSIPAGPTGPRYSDNDTGRGAPATGNRIIFGGCFYYPQCDVTVWLNTGVYDLHDITGLRVVRR